MSAIDDCCGSPCEGAGNEKEPCYGYITVIDEECNEDYSECRWVHACDGHRNWPRPYVQESK